MNDIDRLETFLRRLTIRPLPGEPMTRLRVLARELAEGSVEGVWDGGIREVVNFTIDEATGDSIRVWQLVDAPLKAYVSRRWNDHYPRLSLLVDNGYLTVVNATSMVVDYQLTKAAYDLIGEAESADIFISYRRKDSSAFALLVLARLKAEGLNAFLDLTIQPGDNWRDHIKAQIQGRGYFVLLVGPETLSSDVVHQEIAWALEVGAAIIPIWHGGYRHTPGAPGVPAQIDQVLATTHTIRVLEESALAYNNAIIELLNRFGITP